MSQLPLFADGQPRCACCGRPFRKHDDHHVFCSPRCRQQAYRNRHTDPRQCPACGASVKGRARYCGNSCAQRMRRWKDGGRFLQCVNPECPRHGVQMVHPWDQEAQAWKCNGCGQLQWW